jgi:hypothetical protein
MWVCARCGEKFADEFNVCQKCGAPRAGGRGGDEAAGNPPPNRPLTEAGFATVMLRLLGVCLATIGFLALVGMTGHVVVRAYKLGADKAFDRYSLDYFIYPLGELIAGIYFLLGGQWVFNKILTPVRQREDDDIAEEESN